MAKTTESEVERWMRAMPAEQYDIRAIWHDKSDKSVRPHNRKVGADKVEDLISFFKAENAKGYNVVGRAVDYRYIFLDDISKEVWDRMIGDGFRPCVVVESSPRNFQAFVDAGEGTEEHVAKALARSISARYGGDPGSADAHHLGRVPGFTNRKMKYRGGDGLYPYAGLKTASRRVCPVTSEMRTSSEIIGLAAAFQAEKEGTRSAADWVKETQASPSGGGGASAENGSLRDPGNAQRTYQRGIEFFYSKYGSDTDRSRADYGVAYWMMKRGFPEDSIVAAISTGEKAIGQSDPILYAARTVMKARAEFCKTVDETHEERELPLP